MSVFASLQVDRPRLSFMAVQSPAGDARDLLMVDDGGAVLYDRDMAPEERDLKGLPFARPARLLGRRSEETINAAGVMAGRLLNRVVFHLHFVTAAQIDAAVRSWTAVKFDVQLEIFEWVIVDQLGSVPGTDQGSIFDGPWLRGIISVRFPPAQILAVK